eukprot:scaffold24447_cov150-Skeletonema_dohrnii-CCMP3373.AAC.2
MSETGGTMTRRIHFVCKGKEDEVAAAGVHQLMELVQYMLLEKKNKELPSPKGSCNSKTNSNRYTKSSELRRIEECRYRFEALRNRFRTSVRRTKRHQKQNERTVVNSLPCVVLDMPHHKKPRLDGPAANATISAVVEHNAASTVNELSGDVAM